MPPPPFALEGPLLYVVLAVMWLSPLLVYIVTRLVPPPPPSDRDLRMLKRARWFVRVMLYHVIVLGIPLSLIIHRLTGVPLSWAYDGPRWAVYITVMAVAWLTVRIWQDNVDRASAAAKGQQPRR